MHLSSINKAYSHANISLQKNNNNIYVIKKTIRNKKNLLNLNKIKTFPNFIFNNNYLFNFKNVSISNVKLYDNRIIAKINFINGDTGFDILKYMKIEEILKLRKSIIFYIDKNIENSESKLISKELYLDIIYEILLKYKFIDKKLMNFLSKILKKIPSHIQYPIGCNHGDFTFDNMIFKDNEIWLIDQIVSPVETPLQDVVKLYQDIDKNWFIRNGNITDELKIKTICSFFKSDNFFKNLNKKFYTQLFLTELASTTRIIPYIKEDITERWLKYNIAKIIMNYKK